ncbi:MAG: YggS family pyridoxal phosphate-dependent enzyme [Oxalobacteraceae bacterium]|jgi:pyridoxal phosphate enzyme (YggS family)|nr:YggS family pyridoxal phosphate-dependent enzyme [Oxalobacteraceae bacterium]
MSIAENLANLRRTMDQAAVRYRRAPGSVRLLAVSKTFGAEVVIDAADAGQASFGENYLQEALDKQQAVHALRPDLRLEWHFIGPIQSNKTRPIAEHFAWVHALDREKIARRLSEQRPASLPPLNICLQVNVSGEASKSGVAPPEVLALAQAVATLPGLRLRGLMAIPEPANDFESQRQPFALLRTLQQQLTEAGIPTDTLSMGMSADMDAAIAEGATIVRIGTAIFGKRDYAK